MKLDELHTDYLWEGMIGDGQYVLMATPLSENLAKLAFGSKDSLGLIRRVVSKQGSKDLFKNPVLTAIAASVAVTALANYRTNKKNTIKFYASDPTEKRFYQKMIDDLMKTGYYKIVKSKYVSGGYSWLLKRKRA